MTELAVNQQQSSFFDSTDGHRSPITVYEQQYLSVDQLLAKLADVSQHQLPFIIPTSTKYRILGTGCYGVVVDMVMICPMAISMRLECAVKFIKDVPIIRGFGSAPPAIEIDIHRHVWINSRPLTVPEFLSGPHRIHDWVGVAMERMGPSVDLAFVSTKIATKDCLAISADMARCLANVHECGVIHGDIKLSNFVLAEDVLAKRKGGNDDDDEQDKTTAKSHVIAGAATYSSCRIIDFGCSVAEGVFPVDEFEPIYLERGDPSFCGVVRRMPGLSTVNTRSRQDTFHAARCIDVWKLANLIPSFIRNASGFSIPTELAECVKNVTSRMMTTACPARDLEYAIKGFIESHRF